MTHSDNVQHQEESNFTRRANILQSEVDKINTKSNLIHQQSSIHKADMMESTNRIVEVINEEIREWESIVERQKNIIEDKNDIIDGLKEEILALQKEIHDLRNRIHQYESVEVVDTEIVDETTENT